MLGNLSGPTLLVIVFLVLLLFGAPKLPKLASSLGKSMRILKKEVQVDEPVEANADVTSARVIDAEAENSVRFKE